MFNGHQFLCSPPLKKQTAVLKNNGIDTDNFTNWPDITQLVCNNV